MKKYMTLILVGIVVVLAAVLVGVLTFMKNQPPQERAFQPLVEIKANGARFGMMGSEFPQPMDDTLHEDRRPTTLTRPMPVHPNSPGSNVTRVR